MLTGASKWGFWGHQVVGGGGLVEQGCVGDQVFGGGQLAEERRRD